MIYNFIVNFNITKLYVKIMVPSVIILFAIILFVIYISNSGSFEKEEYEHAKEVLTFCATDVDNRFSNYFTVAQNYNNMFKDYEVVNNSNKRDFYNSITKYIVDKNSAINALWVDFDENKLDGLDSKYKNTEYYSDKGRFSVCWYLTRERRLKSNFQKYSSTQQQEFLSQPYMVLPRTTKRPVILEPIIDTNSNINSKNIIFTFSFPVFDKDSNVVGVTGLDINIDNIISMLDKSKTSLVKMFTLVSNKGTYYSHANKELIGKAITDNILYSDYNNDSILNEFSKNKDIILENVIENSTGERIIICYHPIKIKEIDETPLYVGIILEHKAIAINKRIFFTEILQYCIITLIMIIIVIISLAIAIENILSNKIYAEIDNRIAKDTKDDKLIDTFKS